MAPPKLFAELGIIGDLPAFRRVLGLVGRYAAFDAPVLISGETGTGKELIARAVHYLGARRDEPLIPVNCGALPETLLENELFGHVCGAYTDARGEQKGWSPRPRAARCCSTRSTRCPPAPRWRCCASCRSGSTARWDRSGC